MRTRTFALAALTAFFAACADGGPTGLGPLPTPNFDHVPGHPLVRFSEIHYDNLGTDANEKIEISGPAGTDLTGWSVVLYNGSGGAPYNTFALSGTIPATCAPRGVVVVTYGVNGIQNGSPDGFALVNGTTVIEFLSYEGTFAAVGGPANGMTSTDIGVFENGNGPATGSLRRTGSGTWDPPGTADFGFCNDDIAPPPVTIASITVAPASATVTQGGTVSFTAAAFDNANQAIPGVTFTWASDATAIATVDAAGVATAVAPGDANITATAGGVTGTAALHVNAPAPTLPPVRLSEIHYDNTGVDAFEAVEVEGPEGTDLTGWSVVLYNGNGGAPYTTSPLSGAIPAMCSGRGVVVVFYPQDGIQNGAPDGVALVDAGGVLVEFLSYEGTFTATSGPASGVTSMDIGVVETSGTTVGHSLARTATGTWTGPQAATLGACNSGEGPPPPPLVAFSFSGRTAADPALPVGFQDQLFVTVRDVSGPIATAITWSSDDPTVATIDQDGVFTAVAPGAAVLRATVANGTATATYTLPTRVATASATALYAGNAEFGEPADGDPSDDILVRRDQYTASFSPTRGTPNWVSYDLEATHFGAEDRCDCFTFDPALLPALTSYTTAAYTGAGTFHGYGIDRGHLARSFDRTSGSLDNANTFYFTNIIPQAADLNQGPWAVMESYLGDLARLQDREVYIIAGVAGSKGTVKNEGRITIPASVWKVAVILPRDQGLANINSYQDLQVIAVIMPNDPGVRNVDWNTYRTTVDAVEALSGYDLLALLADQVEIAVESNTAPPTAATNGPFTSDEGSAVSVSAAASTDPDGDALTYAWDFGDGSTASGVTASHTWAQDGVYTVRLVVTDTRGLVDTAFTTATVANVAPLIGAFAGASLFPGETYAAAGSFTDPGADTWSATVDYGDGSGVTALPLSGMQFTLGHTYTAAGIFTVTVRVADDDAVSSRTQTVTVFTPVQGVEQAIALVAQLEAAGRLNRGNANSLTAKLDAAKRQLERGNTTPAVNQLEAFLNELEAMVRSGRLSAADAEPLQVLVGRVIRSVST